MGTFSTEIQIEDWNRERWSALDAMVGTGASIMSAPASVLHELGIEPESKQSFRFAQGEVREMDIGKAWVRFEDRLVFTQVVFNDEGTTPLLGAQALEVAFMGVDPVAKRLVPVDRLLL